MYNIYTYPQYTLADKIEMYTQDIIEHYRWCISMHIYFCWQDLPELSPYYVRSIAPWHALRTINQFKLQFWLHDFLIHAFLSVFSWQFHDHNSCLLSSIEFEASIGKGGGIVMRHVFPLLFPEEVRLGGAAANRWLQVQSPIGTLAPVHRCRQKT